MSLYRIMSAGEILRVYNYSELFWDVVYASITAPEVIECEFAIDDDIIESVFVGAGSTHSWWTNGGGKLFPHDDYPNGLPPGKTLICRVSGPASLRIDWYDRPKE